MLSRPTFEESLEAGLESLSSVLSRDSQLALSRELSQPDSIAKISCKTATAILRQESLDLDQFMRRLVGLAQAFAIAPISGFSVGVVALGSAGDLYLGANLEFPGLPLSLAVHAEQACIANAAFHREAEIGAIAFSAVPCGHCRQFLLELRKASDITCLLPDDQSPSLGNLVPLPFGPGVLGSPRFLLDPCRQQFCLTSARENSLALRSLRELSISHAPYSEAPSAVALVCEDHQTLGGAYLESVAFNPSLSPMQAALATKAFSCSRSSSITDAVLVELEQPRISQELTTRAILQLESSACRLQLETAEAR